MKLPDIEYGPVQRSSDTATAPGQAAQGLSKVVAEGLTAWGQELVKTQALRASTKLSERLMEVEQDIDASPYVTAADLRDTLGDNIPAHVQKYLTKKNDQGEVVDNDQIPTWAVFGPLYDAKAKKALEEASGDIDMVGWRTHFKDRAAEAVLARKSKINERQTRAMLEYMDVQQKSDVDKARSIARTPEEFAALRADVMASGVWDAARKKQEVDLVYKAEQIHPILEASNSNDPDKMREQITRLEAGGEDVAYIQPEQREAYVSSLRHQLEAREREQKEEEDTVKKANETFVWNLINEASDESRRAGRRLTSKDFNRLMPKPDDVRPDEWRRMQGALAELTKPPPPQTNTAMYWTVSRSMVEHPEDFKAGFVWVPVPDKKNAGKVVMERRSLYETRGHFTDEDFQQVVGWMRSSQSNQPYVYRGAITDQEAINVALTDRKYDLKTDDEEKQKEIGHLTKLANATLATRAQAKGGALDVGERDLIIREVFDREVKSKPSFWNRLTGGLNQGQINELRTLGVDPEIAVAFYEGTATGGRRMQPDEVVLHAKQYQTYERGIIDSYAAYGARAPLSPEIAVHIYYIAERDKTLIDKELQGKLTGDPVRDNALRASLAVRAYTVKGVR